MCKKLLAWCLFTIMILISFGVGIVKFKRKPAPRKDWTTGESCTSKS